MAGKTYRPTKTEVAQSVAADMQEKGQQVTPTAVHKIMTERGINMAISQVGRAIAAQYPRKKVSNRGIRYTAKIAVLADQQTLEVPKAAAHIMSALKFVKDCGGIIAARKALDYLVTFVEPAAKETKNS